MRVASVGTREKKEKCDTRKKKTEWLRETEREDRNGRRGERREAR